MMNIAAKNKRLDYIDGLRGIAVLLVVLTHTWVFTGAPALSFHLKGYYIVLAAIPAIGWVGVNLFLVISGFCLAYPFLQNPGYRDRMTIWRFWMRRVRRIFPTYYISIAVVFLLYAAFGLLLRALPPHLLAGKTMGLGELPSWKEVLPHLFLVQNLSPQHASTINGSYWSLALEFQLYLMFPLLVESFFRWGPWRTVAVVFALQALYRFEVSHALSASVINDYQFVLPKAIFGRMYDFCLGMAAAYVVTRQDTKPHTLTGNIGLWVSAAALASAFALCTAHYGNDTITDFLWATGFASLICYASTHGSACHRVLNWKPLVSIGYVSYSIYLIHQPLVERAAFLMRLFFRPGTAFLIGVGLIPLVILVGFGFFSLFEAPFLTTGLKTAKIRSHGVEVPASG